VDKGEGERRESGGGGVGSGEAVMAYIRGKKGRLN